MNKGNVFKLFAKCSALVMTLLFTVMQSQAQVAPQTGTASYYANKFEGRLTANGEVFNNKAFTAAHNHLPLGTYVKVTNMRNRKWIIVKITDRLHRANKRVLDLTQAAAKKLDFFYRGLAPVKVEVVSKAYASNFSSSQDSNMN
jgi:rare lipoprotein A